MQTHTFASDNFSAVDPRVMDYLVELNSKGHAQSYEGDEVTAEATRLFRNTFGEDIKVVFVPSGTGANILAIKLLVQRPYDALVCTQVSHIYEEEAGALAANAGVQIFTIPHHEGKINLEALKADVAMRKALEFHSAMPKVVSIANSTEYGTYYTPEEVKAIATFCHDNDMYLHMDGCRLANVAVALGISLRECSKDLGVDILTFGGAKNGLMSAEAVVICNAPDSDLPRIQKQTMQLVSKMRYGAKMRSMPMV
jgi:threonine aldolase